MKSVVAFLLVSCLLIPVTDAGLRASPAFHWPGRYKLLLSRLHSRDETARIAAVTSLSSYPLKRIEGPLLKLLDDADHQVRFRAAQVLVDKGSRGVLPRLRAWLSDPDGEARGAALLLMGLIGGDEALAEAVKALRDMDPKVRGAAVAVIGRLGAKKAVRSLLGALSDDAWTVRAAAASALGMVTDPRAVIGLIGVLSDDRPEVRAAAVSALGRIGDPRAAQAVLRTLFDAQEKVRLAAIEALGNLDAPQVVEVLVDRVRRSRDPKERVAATKALGRLRTAPAARALVSLLSFVRDPLRSAVAHELAVAGSVATRFILARLAAWDTKSGEARLLVEALGRIQDSSASGALVKELGRGRVPISVVLAALDRCADWRAVPALVDIALSRDADTALVAKVISVVSHAADERSRMAVIRLFRSCRLCKDADRLKLVALLGRIRAMQAFGDVLRLARKGPVALRKAALVALGWFGDSRAADVLLEVLRDGPSSLRLAAADAAVRSLDHDGLDALLQLVRDMDAGMEARAVALRSAGVLVHRLGGSKGDALALFSSLARGSGPVALAALDALGATRVSKALVVLTGIAFDQGRSRAVRCRAVDMLGAFRRPSLLPKLAKLVQAGSDCAVEAAWVLGKVGHGPSDRRVVERLLASANPGSAVRRNLAASFARLAVVGDRLLLLRLLRDEDPVVRVNALAGLARLGRRHARVPNGWIKKALGMVQSFGVLGEVAAVSAAKLGFEEPRSAAGIHQGSGLERPGLDDWVVARVVGDDGRPRAGADYFFGSPDGFVRSGRLGPDGVFHEERVQEGTCRFLVRQ